METATVTLTPLPPYDFDLTASHATYGRGRYGVDVYADGAFRRLLDVDEGLALVEARSAGSVTEPVLKVEVAAPAITPALAARAAQVAAWVLSAGDDLAPFLRVAVDDPVLAPLVSGMRGLHVARTASVFEALVLAVVGQQISAQVARVLRTRLIESHGRRLEWQGATYHAFPRPAALAEAGAPALRSLGFSQRKADYVAAIASSVAAGDLDLEGLHAASDEEAVGALTALRGVGQWTASWLLIRALGRADAFPEGDLALRRALAALANGGLPMDAQEALRYSVRWSPYRSYATTYIFAALRAGALRPGLEAGP